MKPIQIDTPSILKGKFERYMKRQTSKYRRREIKAWIRGHRKVEPNDKYFIGWSM